MRRHFCSKVKDVKQIEIAFGLARHSEARVPVAGLTRSVPQDCLETETLHFLQKTLNNLADFFRIAYCSC